MGRAASVTKLRGGKGAHEKCVKACPLDDAIQACRGVGLKATGTSWAGGAVIRELASGRKVVRDILWATVIGLAQVNGMRYAVQFEAVLATRSQIWRPQRLVRILGRMGNMGHSGAERRMGISRADPGRASLVQRRPRTAACGTR